MRILYITRANLSLRRAHVVNITETVDALCGIGVETRIASRTLLRELQRVDTYDMVYFRDHHLVLYAWYARLKGKKVVYEAHSTHGLWVLRVLAARVSHGVIFITERLRSSYHMPRSRASTVISSGGIHLADYEYTEPLSVLRAQAKLPLDAYIAMYLGSMRWYNLSVLISMLPMVSRDVQLVLVGLKDLEAEHIRREAKQHGVEERIMIRGRIERSEVPRYLISADVLLNPLEAELPGSISSKLYEYLASGRPIVSTRGGANDELLRHEKNALLVPLNAHAFGDAIERIRRDTAFAAELGRRAKEDAMRYTWEVRATRIRDFLKTLL